MRVFALVFLLLFQFFLVAQTEISGRIVDAQTNKPLAFVTIAVSGTRYGTLSDLDGNFRMVLPSGTENNKLAFHYTGYLSKMISVNQYLSEKNIPVKLEPSAFLLEEVMITQKENPAYRILRNVTANRKLNNPEKIRSFSYTSYNKMFVTADLGDEKESRDTTLRPDSLSSKLKQLVQKQHLFMTESVSERKYMYPGKNSEKILASRVSGFKNSPFTLLATQMQSFSFYEDWVVVFDKHYLNPVAEGSIKKYFFRITDTIFQEKDTVYCIYFRPLKNKNFEGLRGTLFINTDGWAIQNVIAEPVDVQGTLSIKIQQQYEKIENTQWFPVKLNTDWVYLNSSLSDSSVSIANKTSSGNGNLKAVARTYLSNINLHPALSKKEFSEVELAMQEGADYKDDIFWNKYRIDSLDKKEIRTYRKVDSVGKAEKFDKKLLWLELLASGKWNYKKIDFDLNRILKFNEYEGARLGLGVHTSSKLSKNVNAGGYFAYGFTDKQMKFGGDLNILLSNAKEWRFHLLYENDVVETGSQYFFENRKALGLTENVYDFYVKKMDRYRNYSIRTDWRVLKYFRVSTYLQHQQRISKTGFFLKSTEGISGVIDTFNLNEAGVQLKFVYREKFVETPRAKISLGSDFPQLFFNYSFGIQNEIAGLQGDFSFQKIDLRIEQSIRLKSLGLLHLCLNAGTVQGDLPYGYLYNMRGSRVPNFSISTPNSFETMNRNEFVASSFVSLFTNYNIGKFLKKRTKFNPELEFVHNMGVGSLKYPNSHSDIGIKVPDKGYFESGIRLNHLYRSNITGLGIGLFYRYGPYAMENAQDNVYVRMSVGISF